MTTRCPRCKLEHDRVDVVRWLWLFRDTKPKPPGGKGNLVLVMLAARMDAKTGCGWTTDGDLAELAGCSEDVVERATRWGRDRLLLHRVSKGYRITDERAQQSHWLLTDPATQPRIGAAMGDDTQPRADAAMAQSQPRVSARPNPASAPDPTPRQRGSKAKPEKLNQEAKPASSSRRTTRTGSRGEPAATADDDDDPSQPLTAPDARTLLLGLDAAEHEIPPIIGLIAETTGRDPGEYLLEQIGQHGGKRGRLIVRRARRKLGLPEPRPPWCGDPACDRQTRLRVTETGDGPKARKCPECHPDRAAGGGP